MLSENVERCVGLAEQLFATSHPVFMALLLLLQIDGAGWLALQLLQRLHDIAHLAVPWTLANIWFFCTLVEREDLLLHLALLSEDVFDSCQGFRVDWQCPRLSRKRIQLLIVHIFDGHQLGGFLLPNLTLSHVFSEVANVLIGFGNTNVEAGLNEL